ncbi:MAG: prephenate dehydrogenase/arogenate dehydrogenase family protein [Verrucomicrobiota bacterium JB024]|nr:prephenate dehydrogenase/arogenate dehydrogenase family protein [Verrucomicrobiota bacterium JB024]
MKKSPMFGKLTVLGTGLLGASLMQAAKARGLCQQALAWSRRPETRLKCEQQSWCDGVYPTASEAVADADLVVLAVPVINIVPLLEEIAPALKAGALVTDVGSTKSLICRHGNAAMPERATFVGSHPMAGSEKAGLEFASETLFEKRACFVTPLVDTPAPAVEKILRFWRELGMEVATTTPETHDEIVAHISHLPHILASVLCETLAAKDPAWRNYAGNGLRDTTRIAAGDPHLWKAILLENREEILRAMAGFEEHWQQMRAAVANNDPFAIVNLLEKGKAYRDAVRND